VFLNKLSTVAQQALGVSPFVSLLCMFAVLSVSLNVLLTFQVRSLTRERSARITARPLNVGETVQAIAAKRLSGQWEVISYQGMSQSTVLYVFTPPCSWCARNIDNFKALVNKEGGEYRFIGLSLSEEGLAEYVAKNDLKLPIYSRVSNEAKKAYKFSGTPQTMVISPEGRILQNWMGAYVGDQKSQVEGFFHVSLPGLRKPQEENEKKTAN
jgi:peroxiredoxin